MDASSKNRSEKIFSIAERAVSSYVLGILTAEALSQLIEQEWAKLYAEQHGDTQKEVQDNEEQETHLINYTLKRIAQRICSRTLHDAWCSRDAPLHEKAYINLVRYFTDILRFVPNANLLRTYDGASEDAVFQTLEELLKLRSGEKKMYDPAAFLRWSQVILKRKAIAILKKRQGEEHNISLDDESRSGVEEFIDQSNRDPGLLVLKGELREELLHVLMNMRNKNYGQVLILQFLEDLDDAEIAQRMNVKIGMIYLWRHRAFRVLREEHPKIAELLRFLSN